MKNQKPLTNKQGKVRELTEEDFLSAVPLAEVFPELSSFSLKRMRGRPKSDSPKKLQSFKLSGDLIDKIRASGKGYNTRVEQVLREAVDLGRI
jgi:uncharacterized protein (DUF4415 family)